VRLLNELDDMNGLFAGPACQRHDPGRPAGAAGTHLIIPRLPEFCAQYPGIQVRLGSNDRFADLVGEGIDCAIRGGTLRDSSLIARRISAMEQINVASRAYLARTAGRRRWTTSPPHSGQFLLQPDRARPRLGIRGRRRRRTHVLPMRSVVSVSSTEAFLASCRRAWA
jgi:LysR family transcriptional regulator for bpeEF and oprC